MSSDQLFFAAWSALYASLVVGMMGFVPAVAAMVVASVLARSL